MKISNKGLVNDIIEALSDDNLFDNAFLDKGKFKIKLTSKIAKSDNPINELEHIISSTIDECVQSALDNSITNLTELGLVESFTNDKGEVVYKLKN
jgi:hypothetical protein